MSPILLEIFSCQYPEISASLTASFQATYVSTRVKTLRTIAGVQEKGFVFLDETQLMAKAFDL